MVADQWWQKTLINKHSSNNLSLLCPLSQWHVWYGSLSDRQSDHLLWGPSLSVQCGLSNYDIIFLQVSASLLTLHKGSRNWAGVRCRVLRCFRVLGFHKDFPKPQVWDFVGTKMCWFWYSDTLHSFPTKAIFWAVMTEKYNTGQSSSFWKELCYIDKISFPDHCEKALFIKPNVFIKTS